MSKNEKKFHTPMDRAKRPEKTGEVFETQVDAAIQSDGFKRFGNGKELWRLYVLGLLPLGKYYARHADVGLAAVGGKTHRQVDILIINTSVEPHFKHCLEDKWQQSGGSAERKLDSTVADAEHTFKHSGLGTTIIYGGPGFNQDRINYHKGQVNGRSLRAFCTLEEFITAVNSGFLDGGGIATAIAHEVPKHKNMSLWKEEEEEEEVI